MRKVGGVRKGWSEEGGWGKGAVRRVGGEGVE